jgi:sugar phosphate isomerase/epimerase
MRLAIGSHTALGAALGRIGRALLDRPQEAAPLLRWWRSKGVEGVVFYDSFPGFYEVTPQQWHDLKAEIGAAGLEVAVFNALRKSLHMPELAEVDRRKLDTIMVACEVLRPSVVDISVNVPIPAQHDAHTLTTRSLFRGEYASRAAYDMAATALRLLARQCADIGAQLSIELHDDGLQDTAANCLRLLRLIDEPNVGVNPDIGNAYRVPHETHESWREQMTALAPYTNYWEVKNYRRFYVGDERRWYSWNVDLDVGDLNFRESAEILWRAGFRGWVANEGGTGDQVRSTLKYLEYMRWILDEWIPFITSAYPDPRVTE